MFFYHYFTSLSLFTAMWCWLFFFSPALTAALRDLAIQIPQLKKEIQEGLLKNLSLILMGRQLRHPGAPKSPLQPFPMSGKVFLLLFYCHDYAIFIIYWSKGLVIWLSFDSKESLFSFRSILASLTNLADIQDATSITLALKTLGSFDFEGEQFFVILHYTWRFWSLILCFKLAWILEFLIFSYYNAFLFVLVF